MKTRNPVTAYFFVDEAGDPTFYDHRGKLIVGEEGCSKILLLGFIKTKEPESLRQCLNKIRSEVEVDEYLKEIPSINKSLRAFHAKDDCQEVREKVFKAILPLSFKAHFIVARKLESIFKNRHKNNENVFYDDLISKLFENQLHKSVSNIIYFSKRGNKTRNESLSAAIQTAMLTFERKWKTKVESEVKIISQTPIGESCLQIADYMTWAVQRAFVKGENRYLNFIREKISYIVDVYDFGNYPANFYNKNNPFDLKKISPL